MGRGPARAIYSKETNEQSRLLEHNLDFDPQTPAARPTGAGPHLEPGDKTMAGNTGLHRPRTRQKATGRAKRIVRNRPAVYSLVRTKGAKMIRKPIQLPGSRIKSVRDTLLEFQNGICPICDKLITDPVLDHHHKKRIKGTGLIRGVLCRNCNSFIAKSENSCVRFAIKQADLPTILRAVADYLERPHTHYLHPSEKPKAKILQKSSYEKLRKQYNKFGGKKKFPEYPKSRKLTIALDDLFSNFGITPEFYK